MILNHVQIKKAHDKGALFIEDFDEEFLEPASYDLRIGNTGATSSSKCLINIEEKGWLELEPGEFGVLLMHEELKFDLWHVGRIGLKSSFAKKGIVASTGPQIDPGFQGRLKIGVTNLSPRPVRLPFKKTFLTIEFHRLSEPALQGYEGPNQRRGGLEAHDIEFLPSEPSTMSWTQVFTSLTSLTKELHANTERLSSLTDQVTGLRYYFALFATILGLVCASLTGGMFFLFTHIFAGTS